MICEEDTEDSKEWIDRVAIMSGIKSCVKNRVLENGRGMLWI
jgi:hypothetical protein